MRDLIAIHSEDASRFYEFLLLFIRNAKSNTAISANVLNEIAFALLLFIIIYLFISRAEHNLPGEARSM